MKEFTLNNLRSAIPELQALRATRRPHPLLASALGPRLKQLEPETPEHTNISRLLAGEAVAVITGQQCGFLFGPLFTLYKLATAIAAARFLETELKIPAVPVFWVQSEDHDFEEIRPAYLPSNSGNPTTLTLRATDETPHTVSVKHRKVSDLTTASLTDLDKLLADFPESAAFRELIHNSYSAGRGICDAFANLIAELGKQYGLIVFDPLDAEAASLHQSVSNQIYAPALSEFASISDLLLKQGKQQVKVRADSPLCFFHPDGPERPRFRLIAENDKFEITELDRSYSLDELLKNLSENSRHFSSSALIRPLFQDSIFPTAIYVAGPAELEYFHQIEPLYKFFDLEMPVILPRASFLLIDERVKRLLSQLEITAAEVVTSPELLEKKIATLSSATGNAATSLDQLFAQTLEGINTVVAPLRATLQQTDPTLDSAFLRNLTKFSELLGSLQPKLSSAIIRNDTIKSERLAKLKNWLSPEGIPQERFYCGAYFIGRYGRSFFQRLVEETSKRLHTAATDNHPFTTWEFEI